MASTRSKPKLLFFVTEDWYFCSHRLPLAVAAREAGFEVAVATRVEAHGGIIEAAGIRLIPLTLSRGSRNPLADWRTFLALFQILRTEHPEILHNVALKPVLYGALLARLTRVRGVVNAIAGLGHLFASPKGLNPLRRGVLLALKALLRGYGRVIVQNPDDLALLESSGALIEGQAALIRGAGVDLGQFHPSPEPPGPPIVLLAARLLWDKGVFEFVEAGRALHGAGLSARFVIVGAPDPENPGAIPLDTLHQWTEDGIIEWWGHRQDMAAVLRQATLFCLPSYYGEGIPKVLLEAAASARALITTDMPGCREVVNPGQEGLLVPPRNAEALAEAIRTLIECPLERQHMAQKARRRAEAEFGLEGVIRQTLAVYQDLLDDRHQSKGLGEQ